MFKTDVKPGYNYSKSSEVTNSLYSQPKNIAKSMFTTTTISAHKTYPLVTHYCTHKLSKLTDVIGDLYTLSTGLTISTHKVQKIKSLNT